MPAKRKSASDKIIAKFDQIPETKASPDYIKKMVTYLLDELGEEGEREGSPEALKYIQEIINELHNIVAFGQNFGPMRKGALDDLKILLTFAKSLGDHKGASAETKNTVKDFGKTILSEIEKEER